MMRVMSRVATARDFQSSERSLDMKSKTWIAGAIVAVFCAAAFGETKSDYDRSYSFVGLRTWDFKMQTRMPTDPVGTNTIWNQDIRKAITDRLASDGFRRPRKGNPISWWLTTWAPKSAMTRGSLTMDSLAAGAAGVDGDDGAAGEELETWTCGTFLIPSPPSRWT